MEYLGPEVAANFPSFWNFPELKDMVGRGQLKLVSFDQSPNGACETEANYGFGKSAGLGAVGWLEGFHTQTGSSSTRSSRLNQCLEGLGELGTGFGGCIQGSAEDLSSSTRSMSCPAHPQVER